MSTQTDKMVTCWPSLVLAIVGSASASASLAAAAATGRPPSLTELGSAWVDPNKEVSAAAAVGPEQRDLATINNFWGAGGIAPQTLRPVDLVAVNSLELPPYSGCGASMHAGSPSGFGCGRLLVDGVQVAAASTRWQSHEAGRRSAPLAGSSVTVESAMRMPFEQNGVIWEVNFTAAAQQAATIRIDFELAGMMNKRPTVGTWVYPTINTASSFNYTALADSGSGQKGVLSCGGGSSGTAAARDACTRFVFVGPRQPDKISFSPRVPPPPPPPPPPAPSPGLGGCTIAGLWIQEPSTTFGPIVEDKTSGAFSWTNENSTETQKFGWDRLNGTVSKEGKITFHYYHTKARGGAPTPESGGFFGDCDHVKVSDACWHRTTAKPDPACHHHLPAPPPAPEGPSPVPNASFSAVHIQAGETVTIRLALAVGEDAAGAAAAEREFAADLLTFNTAFAEAHSKWQERWALAFKPENGYWSGHMPTLSLPGSSNVERVYYMSALTVVSQMRTNLPLVGPRVWPNGNGNVAFGGARGIGGSRSWWWDESLTSIMLALLEPASRTPTFQAWLAHDDHPGTKFGHGMGNGYPMDCAPIGKGGSKWGVGCGWKNASNGVRSPPPPPPPPLQGPEYGFYCYNPWAYYTMASNHLRINNDTQFLGMQAASSNMTVEEALEGIATDFQEYLIPGTNLVDYGPSMDGFSPTYKHVMPGCSQGNSVWMLRDFAAYRESQGGSHAADAARLRQMAAGLAKDTMEKMYQARDGHGWFNVIFPPSAATDHGTPEDSEGDSLTVMQMRHVVDFFSVTFGLCGITQPGSSLCDFSAQVRRELGDWFRGESVTSTWIRATSPKTNCSTSYTVPKEATAAMVAAAAAREQASSQLQADGGDAEWPAYTTCKAGRPDHGSNGAYPSWPAFAVEALCVCCQLSGGVCCQLSGGACCQLSGACAVFVRVLLVAMSMGTAPLPFRSWTPSYKQPTYACTSNSLVVTHSSDSLVVTHSGLLVRRRGPSARRTRCHSSRRHRTRPSTPSRASSPRPGSRATWRSRAAPSSTPSFVASLDTTRRCNGVAWEVAARRMS
jgi:hypothetical protein